MSGRLCGCRSFCPLSSFKATLSSLEATHHLFGNGDMETTKAQSLLTAGPEKRLGRTPKHKGTDSGQGSVTTGRDLGKSQGPHSRGTDPRSRPPTGTAQQGVQA